MKTSKLQQGFSLVAWIILVVGIGLFASIACSCASYTDYIKRAKVTESLALATSAKTAVAENVANGKPFNTGWIAPNATANVSTTAAPTSTWWTKRATNNANSGISINPANGIITITYTDKIATGSPTLLLLPIIDAALPVSGVRLKTNSTITWECHSATAPANDLFATVLGTINPKYVLSNCRL